MFIGPQRICGIVVYVRFDGQGWVLIVIKELNGWRVGLAVCRIDSVDQHFHASYDTKLRTETLIK